MKSEDKRHPYASLDRPDTNNRTFIPWYTVPEGQYGRDGIEKRSYYRRLDEYNSGIRNGVWTHDEYWTYRDSTCLAEALGSQLGLHCLQVKKASRWLCSLDLEHSGVRKDWIAFTLCSYVVHNTPRSVRKCHPNCKGRDELFCQVQESLGLSDRNLHKLYQRYGEGTRVPDDREPVPFDAYGMDNAAFNPEFDWGVMHDETFAV